MRKNFLILISIMASLSYISYGSDSGLEMFKLEESVITTTGFETNIRDIPGNVSVITSEEIQEKGYTVIEEVLSKLPSVNITRDAFGSSIDLRGQGGNKARSNVKILVDGVSIVPLNKSHSKIPLDSIDIYNIESIEIISGGGAILYGAGTAGGVINIITKTGVGMTPLNKVNFEVGSYGRERVAASAGSLINDNLLVQSNILYEEGEAYLDEKDSKVVTGDILARYAPSSGTDITLKYEKSKDVGHDPGALLTLEEYEEDRQQVGINADVNQSSRTDRDMATLIYNKRLRDNLKLSIQSTYQLKNDEFYSDKGDKAVESLNNEIKEEQIDINPKLQLKYGNNSTLVLGFDYNYLTSSRDIFGTGKRKQESSDKRSTESYSVYALNNYKINKLELVQGIRYNYTENTYQTRDKIDFSKSVPKTTADMNNMAYELAVNYLYSDTGNTYVKWERGFNTPNPTSIFNNPSDDQIAEGYAYGLSDVEEEIYDSYEIGMRDFFLNSSVNLSLFYSKTRNEIYRDGNSKNWVSYNLDETQRKGLELSLEQYFGKLTLSESYSYIDAEIIKGKYEGNKVPGVSKNSFYLSAKYEFTYKLNAILSTLYKDAVYINNENKGGKVNDYTLTNLIVNYKLKDNVRLYFGINNLFNEKYASQFKIDMYRAADERNYYAGINYTF